MPYALQTKTRRRIVEVLRQEAATPSTRILGRTHLPNQLLTGLGNHSTPTLEIKDSESKRIRLHARISRRRGNALPCLFGSPSRLNPRLQEVDTAAAQHRVTGEKIWEDPDGEDAHRASTRWHAPWQVVPYNHRSGLNASHNKKGSCTVQLPFLYLQRIQYYVFSHSSRILFSSFSRSPPTLPLAKRTDTSPPDCVMVANVCPPS